MEEAIKSLILSVRELEAIFRSYEESHWADWLEEDASLLEAGNLDGIDHLLSAYGGMGSINDVFISPEAGYAIEESDMSQVNSQIKSMLTEIYTIAKQFKRNSPKG